MKTLMKIVMISLVSLTSSLSFAWVEKNPTVKEYNFKYELKKSKSAPEQFTYTRKAASYEEALESAAQSCFNHFKNGRHLSEDEGLDIIDVCANPRG